MWSLIDLINNFFTHKDFLPSPKNIPGTLFTPLHIVFSAFCIAVVLMMCVCFKNKSEKAFKTAFAVIWAVVVVLEIIKIVWETFTGARVEFEASGIIPLYPCSIFMYAMPFAIWGKGLVRRAACGYVCTLGFLGGAINFVYPANILSHYSCISFAGLHTFLYHGAIVFCAITMLLTGYHKYTGISKWWELILPCAPLLIVSFFANAVNFSPIDSDYMFFKLDSFIFAPLGQALSKPICVIIVYLAYLLIHSLPYIPSYISNRKKNG